MKGGPLVRWQAVRAAPRSAADALAGLRDAERSRVERALSAGLRALAIEFVWRRALARLKRRLAVLGLRFLGELLDRRDVEESWLPDAALSDGDALTLAEGFGVIDATAALRLQQAFEEVCALVAAQAAREPDEAATTEVLAAVAPLLAAGEAASLDHFRAFRDRLASHALAADDAQTRRLVASSPLYLHTTVRTLLAIVRSAHGDPLRRALENLESLLPGIWPRLSDEDRGACGFVYAEMAAEGKADAVTGLRDALSAVEGFAYVPGDLSADPYRRAAQLALAAHGNLDRASAEARAIRGLLSLPAPVPRPALIGWTRACLALTLAGDASDPAARARELLDALSDDDWLHYLDCGLPRDPLILATLASPLRCARFADLVTARGLRAPAAPRAAQFLDAVRKRTLPALVTRCWRQLHGLNPAARRHARS